MEDNIEKRRKDYRAKQNFKGLPKAIRDAYFQGLKNINEASEEDKIAFLAAETIIRNFNNAPEKSWKDLVILQERKPNITNLYVEDFNGRKKDLVSIALEYNQFKAATLFIDGEDSLARKEAQEIAERDSITDGGRSIAEFKEEWGTPLYSKTKEQQYLLLMMIGETSNSFGIYDKKNQPLDLPACLIKTYDLNPHKKIKFSVNDNELIETPFSYALMCAEKQGKNFQVPKFETGFYRNADLNLENIFGYELPIQIVSFSPDISAKLLMKRLEKEPPKTDIKQTSDTKKFEQPVFDFFNDQSR